MDEQLERIRALLDEHVPKHTDAVLATAVGSLRLFPEGATPDSEAVGATRFGGGADLPGPEAWPSFEDKPMVFLLQIRLGELPEFPGRDRLPASGLLSFFVVSMWFDPDDLENETLQEAYGMRGAVVHSPSVEGLVSVSPPYADMDDAPFPVDAASVRFETEWCLPPLECEVFDPVRARMTNDEYATYWDEVWMHRNRFDEDDTFHRLLGHPDMNFNSEVSGVDLLLQISSDMSINWELGDYQPVRFQIPRSDLKAGNFDNVEVDCQLT